MKNPAKPKKSRGRSPEYVEGETALSNFRAKLIFAEPDVAHGARPVAVQTLRDAMPDKFHWLAGVRRLITHLNETEKDALALVMSQAIAADSKGVNVTSDLEGKPKEYIIQQLKAVTEYCAELNEEAKEFCRERAAHGARPPGR